MGIWANIKSVFKKKTAEEIQEEAAQKAAKRAERLAAGQAKIAAANEKRLALIQAQVEKEAAKTAGKLNAALAHEQRLIAEAENARNVSEAAQKVIGAGGATAAEKATARAARIHAEKMAEAVKESAKITAKARIAHANLVKKRRDNISESKCESRGHRRKRHVERR